LSCSFFFQTSLLSTSPRRRDTRSLARFQRLPSPSLSYHTLTLHKLSPRVCSFFRHHASPCSRDAGTLASSRAPNACSPPSCSYHTLTLQRLSPRFCSFFRDHASPCSRDAGILAPRALPTPASPPSLSYRTLTLDKLSSRFCYSRLSTSPRCKDTPRA